jgi:hypothetical protein
MAQSTSTQEMVRAGEPVDLYYYDGETSKKQAFPTTQNTKYVQSFNNLSGGSSVFTIPPTNGIQDVVCEFQMPALTGTSAQLGAVSLPRGWGYALIKQVTFRYGGSSQYYLTGDQILQNALRRQPSRTTADDLFALGGSYSTGSAVGSSGLDVPQYAAVVLTLPHNIPSGFGKSHPLPTDLLTQQVQVTVELNPVQSVFSVSSAPTGGAPAIPSSLAFAQFQVQQVMFNNQGDSLARRVDMSVNAYAFPCEFVQQIQRINLANSSASQSVVLTGFRSGEVKAVHLWLTRASDTPANPGVAGAINNPFNWYLPLSVIMTYAGDIYARYEYASSPLWNLINGDKAPAFDNVGTADGTTTLNVSSVLQQWVELPFAQTNLDDDSHYILSHGKPITNGIVNLQLQTPSAQNDWVLNVSYIYNATLLFSQGTCDYVF